MSDMGYFHVLLTLEGEEMLALRDLTEAEMKSQFIKPYGRGETLMIGSKVVMSDRVQCVRVLVSSEHSKVLLARERQRRIDAEDESNRKNTRTSVVGSHELDDDDLADLSVDVTVRYLQRWPRSKPGRVALVGNNPWVLGVVAALIATVVAAYVTQKLGLT